jgi:hypothetical protein
MGKNGIPLSLEQIIITIKYVGGFLDIIFLTTGESFEYILF